jgi:hypothetical protein
MQALCAMWCIDRPLVCRVYLMSYLKKSHNKTLKPVTHIVLRIPFQMISFTFQESPKYGLICLWWANWRSPSQKKKRKPKKRNQQVWVHKLVCNRTHNFWRVGCQVQCLSFFRPLKNRKFLYTFNSFRFSKGKP